MRATIKAEFFRLLRNPCIYISLGVGLLIAVSQYFQNVLPCVQYLETYKKAGLSMIPPHSVYAKWIGGESWSLQSFLYFLIIPILSSLPWSLSVLSERSNGVDKMIFIRSTKLKYYLSKFFVVFLFGGVCTCVPLVVNLLLTYATLPSITPDVATGFYAVDSFSMWANLFYSVPVIYVALYIFIIFMFSGAIAVLSGSFGLIIDNAFINAVAPFVLYIFLYSIFFGKETAKYSPFNFLSPVQEAPGISLHIIVIEWLIIMLISTLIITRAINRDKI